ncbi:MAG: SusC/RagA family TonB-linked outer membrane protein [Candidatus Cyclobacteriaceae bacterium M3_2C_046]
MRTKGLLFKRLTFMAIAMAMALGAYAQRTVTGMVTDLETGSALPGVNVLVKGTGEGTVTDVDGDYSIRIPGDAAVLVFSYVGYTSEEITVMDRDVINIALTLDIEQLSEVVVTGYSTQSKRDITGSVSTVSAEELTAIPTATVEQQLQGRAPGVNVISDNRPGGGAQVRIRGIGTFNNTAPLYVIDGVPTRGGFQRINPQNIESMQILKDASAASIYGARAANGVVIITTKKGDASGQPQINFSSRVGVQRPVGSLDLIIDPQQLAEVIWTSRRNANQVGDNGNPTHPQYGSGSSPVIPDYIFPSGAFEGDPSTDPSLYSDNPDDLYLITRAARNGTDWYDEIFRTAPLQEYNLNASGGNENGRYYLGLNYFDQQGIVEHSSFKRYSLRANTEFSVFDRFRIGENLEVSYTDGRVFGNNDEGNPVSMSYRVPSIMPVYDINGFFAGSKGGGLTNGNNPMALLWRSKDNPDTDLRIFGGAFAEFDVLEDLTLKSQVGIDYEVGHNWGFSFLNIEAAEVGSSNGFFENMGRRFNWTWTNTAEWRATFNDIHRLNVLVGSEAIEETQRGFGANRQFYFSSQPSYRYLGTGEGGINNGGGGYEWALFSVFGKVNYALMDKYRLEVTVRRDGSSRFGPNFRYGTFPAFSAGWTVSEEDFMANVPWISYLNLRGGWGQTGNQEIDNYNFASTYGTSLLYSAYDIGGSNTGTVAGFDAARFGNLDTRWEATETTNIGLDATLFADFSLTFDWYTRSTTDMLYGLPLPATRGNAAAPAINVAEMKNTGFDIGLSYTGASADNDFTYNFSANVSHYTNELVALGIDQPLQGGLLRGELYTQAEPGMPISSFFGYMIDGIYQNEQEIRDSGVEYPGYTEVLDDGSVVGVGKFRYQDVSGPEGVPDGVITPDDRTYIGNPHPDFTYGFNANLNYKNFNFTLFLQGSQGNDVINYVRRWIDFNKFQGNRSVRVYNDTWTPQRPNASLPILDANDNISDIPSTYFVEDGSYMRIKNIQLGYTFPESLGVRQLQVYVQATNLLTFTSYSGLDPEIPSEFGDRRMGVDEGLFPAAQNFILGVNLGL